MMDIKNDVFDYTFLQEPILLSFDNVGKLNEFVDYIFDKGEGSQVVYLCDILSYFNMLTDFKTSWLYGWTWDDILAQCGGSYKNIHNGKWIIKLSIPDKFLEEELI